MKDSDVFYALEVSDIQSVAEESIGRILSSEEVTLVASEVEKQMPWYDVIEDSIERVISE